jgi:hypothetical protein
VVNDVDEDKALKTFLSAVYLGLIIDDPWMDCYTDILMFCLHTICMSSEQYLYLCITHTPQLKNE